MAGVWTGSARQVGKYLLQEKLENKILSDQLQLRRDRWEGALGPPRSGHGRSRQRQGAGLHLGQNNSQSLPDDVQCQW